MKYGKTVIIKATIGVVIALLLIITLALNIGCNVGSTNIRLEGIITGPMMIDGKPIQGLPSEEIDLLLKVAAKEITVKYNDEGAILTLSPSGATIEIKDGGILINGIKPEQIKVEWAVSKQD
jgi:hypothetical protein